MTKIHLLDQQTANSIAAGEVVERPSSVVKELVENALDAGASVIAIEISQGGIRLIRVTDNGIGMDDEDARLAFGRHATSKLNMIEDLDTLVTMGFRGEALASIAAVAKVTLDTRQSGSDSGARIVIEGGKLVEQQKTGCPEGTCISVENLFFNVPARFKFLRKDSTEAGHIAELVERMALARPDVSFRLVSNQQEVLHTPGNNDLLSAVYAVFGRQTAQDCLPVDETAGSLRICGLIGRPASARSNRGQQCLYVNGRLVRSRAMTAALDEAYKTRLMKGKYAVAILFLTVPTQLVDINVHPQKLEVRFWNDSEVFRGIYHAVRSALGDGAAILSSDDNEAAGDERAEDDSAGNESAEAAKIAGDTQAAVQQELPAAWQQVGLLLRDRQTDTGNAAAAEEVIVAGTAEQTAATAGGAELPEGKMTIHELADARLIGSLFRTYILLETADTLLLVDQHAAHEKIIFERLVARHHKALTGGTPLIQDLLVPVVIDVGRRDLQTLQDEEKKLKQLGFDCSPLGATSVAVRSIPDTGDRPLEPGPALRMALAAIQQDQLKADDAILDVFYQMACKAAVKAHDHLDSSEIEKLLLDLQQLDDPYHCPHGRPVIVQLSRRDIEKRFRRIV
jgi:DNA mismatch repair protein MutL